MNLLQITVVNNLGKFTGYLASNEPNASQEDLEVLMAEMTKSVNNIQRLTIEQKGGAVISFPEEIIKHSVIIMEVVSTPDFQLTEV